MSCGSGCVLDERARSARMAGPSTLMYWQHRVGLGGCYGNYTKFVVDQPEAYDIFLGLVS